MRRSIEELPSRTWLLESRITVAVKLKAGAASPDISNGMMAVSVRPRISMSGNPIAARSISCPVA
ncbi:MAG: hypothetical protein DCC68_25435 [Planctomycetota bacterium]|nr:MAG: hypothetical protein DCC68_25435 [Planctomycetota bacterium]